jgi:signal transduction histidine kinase
MLSAQNTAFASPERVEQEIVLAQYETFVGTHCRAFFDTLPTMIMALNCHRQVVFANKAAVDFLGREDVEQVLGKRPGEALGCVNASVGPGGCGTSRHCRNCGAVRAILAAVDGAVSDGQCKLLRREQSYLEGLDLHVNATPLAVDGMQFIIFAITDISHEMRRRSMERIFFHDVLNLAGGINGLVEVLRHQENLGDSPELSVLHSATQTLVDEIIAQRELLAAESNELRPVYALTGTKSLLEQLLALYGTSPAAQGQTLALHEPCADCVIETDPRIVQRVLGNMIKNALEAGHPGDDVRLACVDEGTCVRYEVRNAAVIPQEIQVNIFHRRFSTKGDSRGLGTYSMLLLTERYLCGEVGFNSAEGQGTTFHLRLPKRLETA